MSEGRRNNDLMSLAGSLRKRNTAPKVIESSLMAVNHSMSSPLTDDEVLKIAEGVQRYSPMQVYTEQTLAKEFASQACDHLAYSEVLKWMSFDGRHWRRDHSEVHVQEMVKNFLTDKLTWIECRNWEPGEIDDALKLVRRMQTRAKITAIFEIARSDDLLLSEHDWNDSLDCVNFQNGTLHLSKMEFRPHNPDDRLTKVLPYDYDPACSCAVFQEFISKVLSPDVRDFVQRLFGASLAGGNELQVFPLLLGSGRNGKSTLVDTICTVMGAYAGTIEPATIMKTQNKSAINNDIASMRGKRFIATTELNVGQVMDAATIKKMTGGDTFSARFLYGEHFDMKIEALIVMASNFPPLFDGSDTGITRRLRIIKFDRYITDQEVDLSLGRKLRDECTGIMNWLIEGYRSFSSIGLSEPQKILSDTLDVVRDGNQAMQFLYDCCDQRDGLKTPADVLFNTYSSWALGSGLRPMSIKSFKQSLERTVGFGTKRASGHNFWPGIGIVK